MNLNNLQLLFIAAGFFIQVTIYFIFPTPDVALIGVLIAFIFNFGITIYVLNESRKEYERVVRRLRR